MQKIKKVPDLTILNSPEETDYFVGYDTDQADPDKATVLIPVAKGRNIIVDSITALEALTGTVDGQVVKVKGYYAGVPLDMPDYVVDISSTDTPNGGSIIARAEGGNYVWKSVLTVDVRQFGAKGDDDGTGLVGQNDTPFIQNALSLGLPVDFGTYKYAVNTATSELLFTNSMRGDGAVITNNDDTNFTFKISYTGTTDKNFYHIKVSGLEIRSKYGLTFNEERVNITDAGGGGAPLKGMTVENCIFEGLYSSSVDPNYYTSVEVPLDLDDLPAELEGYGIGLKYSKCFGTVTKNNLFKKHGIAIALYGSDINTIKDCRFEVNARHINDYRTNTFGSQTMIDHCDILKCARVGGITTSGLFTNINDNYFENSIGSELAARFIHLKSRQGRITKNRFDSPGAGTSERYPDAMYFDDNANAFLDENVWNYSGANYILGFSDNFKAITSTTWFPSGGFAQNNVIILGNNYFVKLNNKHPRLLSGQASRYLQGALRNETEIDLNVYCSFQAQLGNQYENVLCVPYSSMTNTVGENDSVTFTTDDGSDTGTVFQNIENSDGTGILYILGSTDLPTDLTNIEVDVSNYVVSTTESYFKWMISATEGLTWQLGEGYLRSGKNYRVEITPICQSSDNTLIVQMGSQSNLGKYLNFTVNVQSTNNQDTYIFNTTTHEGIADTDLLLLRLTGFTNKMLIRDVRIRSDNFYTKEFTWDIPSIPAGGTTFQNVTIAGVDSRDTLTVTRVGGSGGLILTASWFSPNIARVYAYNPTGAAIDLADASFTLKVERD